MTIDPAVTPIMGLVGCAVAAFIYFQIRKMPAGDGLSKQIAEKISRGAMVFMRRELLLITFFGVVVGGAILLFKTWDQALAFFLGAISSSLAGFFGMKTATIANVRTTVAARDHGAAKALNVAFSGGAVMGITVASAGLLGLGILYWFFGVSEHGAEVLEGFAMGASLVALFYRVGGGIFTKAADVGADLVGKVEAGIPEDDPRNPGVIADNVGDNVGDVAGMGSDIFESYCGAQVATLAIASSFVTGWDGDTPTGVNEAATQLGITAANVGNAFYLPLALTTVGLICSLLGILLVRLSASQDAARALRIGTIGAAVLFIAAAFGVVRGMDLGFQFALCVLAGAVGGIVIGLVTEYYTGGKPVRDIAKSGQTGVATIMISGLSVGLKSVAIPLITIAMVILTTSTFAGLYGVGLAAVGMLGTVGITMAIDAYGPVADNAGGIAEMTQMGEKTRKITDSLDAVGNTTAAIGKGFAIGAAGLAALALITAFVSKTGISLALNDPAVIIGLFLGGGIPFLNGAITMNAVGDAAFDMISEIRRQFKEKPGILKGSEEPDTDRCIDIATKAATKRMVLPALLAVGSPVLVGVLFGPKTLGGMLCGALLGCVLLALMMSNAGGAWDNAKKFVEEGNFGGKNSETHRGCVVGDTVGDPFKDTSGPSMNILINVMAIVSLVIADNISAGHIGGVVGRLLTGG